MARHALPNLSWDESHSIETDHVTVRSQHSPQPVANQP